ncbi:cholinephosphate cytidylyltransferase [Lentinula aff. detonsa]|uniref:choline-phosphate cytidylyltransferase n=2 Tax=Lentinula TaxID=5352 RepID=A0AA38NQP9_9AGAR|nr:cholinephosphate cytidylyltransferase [Lentinula aff. detonsa]KAJ3986024.1 cholinephosphate cytidylyltransferase [Lentinula detonsa]
MDPPASVDHKEPARKTLPRKRSFGKYPSSKVTDSPAYDASEEDNDPTDVDDAASAVSVSGPSSSSRARTLAAAGLLKSSSNPAAHRKHHLASSIVSDSDGVDSPTYDGDIESSTTAGPESPHPHSSLRLGHHHSMSSHSTLNTPAYPGSETTTDYIETPGTEEPRTAYPLNATSHPLFITPPSDPFPHPQNSISEPAVPSTIPSALSFNPAALRPEDIQLFVQRAIDGAPVEGSGVQRAYKINRPPEDRPVRVYADGVYDLFHFGHALQLRQAKLSFPSVYLLVGVCSDELVIAHKAKSIMSHAERLEALRHCRWVDQVVPEAPWVLTPEFVEKYQIDFVAHDEDPYKAEGLGQDDVYEWVKRAGKFLPTRRTPGISTSALLERIVDMYKDGIMDRKLEGMGRGDLTRGG